MAALKRATWQGVLLVEAVVAAFLMLFAFAAASSLFDASLRWEASSANLRRAALLAEREIGRIRAWSLEAHQNSSFNGGWGAVTGIRPTDPESPGFEVEVLADLPHYGRNATTGEVAPPGVYSPTSHFWAPLLFPTEPPLPATFLNPQKDERYQTYARVRSFPGSFRRVQVIVRYGEAGEKEYRAVTLVGDPIAPINPVLRFQRVSGPSSLGPGAAADYSVSLTDGAGGHAIEDIVALWSADPRGTGALVIKPLDANGRKARVFRDTHATAGQTRLAVRVRYRGQEVSGFSDPITVL